MQFRQGDVLVERIEAIPEDAKAEIGPVILAHGEATGHAHTIKSRYAKLLSTGTDRFLRTTKPVRLVHQEHGAIEIPAGEYRVTRQREYSPEAIRNVAD